MDIWNLGLYILEDDEYNSAKMVSIIPKDKHDYYAIQ
jgi:hypothetical protein